MTKQPLASWDFRAFESTFGHLAPAEHSKTLAHLKRHIHDLSERHQAELRDLQRLEGRS